MKYCLKTLFLAVTARCNLRCRHCSVRTNRSLGHGMDQPELSLSEIESLAISARQIGAEKVVLSGGEPTMRSDFPRIVDTFLGLGYRVIINTNGTYFNPELQSVFHRHCSRVSVGVSLDGSEDFHDGFRGKRGSFRRTFNSIQNLQGIGSSVEVNCTVLKDNFGSCLDLINLLKGTSSTIRYTPYVAPSGAGKSLQHRNIDAYEIMSLIETVSGLRLDGFHVYVNAPIGLLHPRDAEVIECGWGRSLCGVRCNGDVCICPVTYESGTVAGNIREESLSAIWTGADLFLSLRRTEPDHLEGVCRQCIVREYCRGGCRLNGFIETGRFTAPNTLCQKVHDAGLFPVYALESKRTVEKST
jgi:radical SAM protein with 4Fe4S-binding SPASM domain